MSVFSDDRAAIAEAVTGLGAGWSVYDHLPGRAIPPCYIVLHGSPLIDRENGDTFGKYTSHYELWCVARPAQNDVETATAEDGAEAAAEALLESGILFTTIDQPVSFDLNGTDYFAICIHISLDTWFSTR